MSSRTVLMSLGMRVQTYQQLKDARAFLREAGLVEVQLPTQLHPGIAYATHFMLDDIHCIELYFEMEQFGTGPVVRAADDALARSAAGKRIELRGAGTIRSDGLNRAAGCTSCGLPAHPLMRLSVRSTVKMNNDKDDKKS